MPTEDDPRLQGYQPSSDFAPRDSDRSSRQILDFPGRKPKQSALNPAELVYGYWEPNELSTPQTAVLTNIGYQDLPIASIRSVGEWTVTTDCPSTLRPGETCSITAYFNPLSSGLKTGAIYVDTGDAGGQKVVILRGAGSLEAGQLLFMPSNLAFPNTGVNLLSPSQSVILRNTGATFLALNAISVSGQFLQTNDCGPGLNPNETCTVQVTFAPTSLGSASGALSVVYDETRSGSVPLNGLGIANDVVVPAFSVFSPTFLNFGDVQVDEVSEPEVVTMTNTGTEFLGITSIAVPAGYTQTNNCGSGLAGGASCQITVTAAPTVEGTIAGNLFVTHSGAGANTVPLTMNAVLENIVEFTVPPTVAMPNTVIDEPTSVVFAVVGDDVEGIVLTSLPADGAGMTFLYSDVSTGPFTARTAPVNLPANTSLYVQATYVIDEVGVLAHNAVFESATQTETVIITTNILDLPTYLWADVFDDHRSTPVFGDNDAGLDWTGWGTSTSQPAEAAIEWFMHNVIANEAPEGAIIDLISPTGSIHIRGRLQVPPQSMVTNLRLKFNDNIVERGKGPEQWGQMFFWGLKVVDSALPDGDANVGADTPLGGTVLTMRNTPTEIALLAAATPGSIIEIRTDRTRPSYHPDKSRAQCVVEAVNPTARTITVRDPLTIAVPQFNPVNPSFETTDLSSVTLLQGSLLTANAARGSNQIVMANVTGLSVGDWLLVGTDEIPGEDTNQFYDGFADPLQDTPDIDVTKPADWGDTPIPINEELMQITAINTGTKTVTLHAQLNKNKLLAWGAFAYKIDPIRDFTFSGGRFNGQQDNESTDAWDHQYIWTRYMVDSVVKDTRFDDEGRPAARRRTGQAVRFDTGQRNVMDNLWIGKPGDISAGRGYGVSFRRGERSSVIRNSYAEGCRHSIEFWSSSGECTAEFNHTHNTTSSCIDTHGNWNYGVIIRDNLITRDRLTAELSTDLSEGEADNEPDAIRIGNNKFIFDEHIRVSNNRIINFDGNAISIVPQATDVVVDGLEIDGAYRILNLQSNSRHNRTFIDRVTIQNVVADNIYERMVHIRHNSAGTGALPRMQCKGLLLKNFLIGSKGQAIDHTKAYPTPTSEITGMYIWHVQDLVMENWDVQNLNLIDNWALYIENVNGINFKNFKIEGKEGAGFHKGIRWVNKCRNIEGDITITGLEQYVDEKGKVSNPILIDYDVAGDANTFTKAGKSLTVYHQTPRPNVNPGKKPSGFNLILTAAP